MTITVLALTLVMVSSTTASATVAEDHFRRDLTNGWGRASPGGSYSLAGPVSDFWTSTAPYRRGLGYMRAARAGVSRGAILRAAVASDVDIHLTVTISARGPDGPYYVYAAARSTASTELRARLVYNRDCTLSTLASVVESGRERPLGTAVIVPGARWCGAHPTARTFNLHALMTGTQPVSVRIKVWAADGSAEPSTWLWSGTSTAAVAASGAVGLRAYVSSAARSGTDFVFYNWSARKR